MTEVLVLVLVLFLFLVSIFRPWGYHLFTSRLRKLACAGVRILCAGRTITAVGLASLGTHPCSAGGEP